MNKKEFVKAVRGKAQVEASLDVVQDVVTAVAEVIKEQVVQAGRFQFYDLGVFEKKLRPARKQTIRLAGGGRILDEPKTIDLPVRTRVVFRAAKPFKEMVQA